MWWEQLGRAPEEAQGAGDLAGRVVSDDWPRTMQRRFEWLGRAFSKSWDKLWAACALHMGYFNFVWTPKPLNGFTPAAELNVTDKLWSVEDLVGDC